MAREEALFELQCQRAIVVNLIFLSRIHVKYDDALLTYKNSLEFYNKALKIAPNYVNVHNDKALLLQIRGELMILLNRKEEACPDFKDSINDYTQSLLIAPNNSNIKINLQEVLSLVDKYCLSK